MSSPDAVIAVAPVVAALERLDVPYYLGGSVASSAHGLARATLDVDLVADLSPKHAVPLVQMLARDYYVNQRGVSEAIARQSCFNAIHLASMFKVDVFVVKDRPYDRVALGRIRKAPLDVETPATEFYFASPEDIVLAKLERFRAGGEVSDRQWQDVLGVLSVQHDRLDHDYLNKWASELGIADLLERARRELKS